MDKTLFIMPKFLIPLLAAFALPNAVNAENYSLVMTMYSPCTHSAVCASDSHNMYSVPMASLEQCERSLKIAIENLYSPIKSFNGRLVCMPSK